MNKPAPKITPDLVAEHGLSSDEYRLLAAVLGREPSLTELGIFSVMCRSTAPTNPPACG
jgi:phosphoribosylformylglycinamidine synthase